ncbi:hypothetical protein CDAR_229091 [Caerostris darwini]|uniref:Uncharacterized protein n=1 Tax=Caerostris darwini TaxID=1538125 RepID=A0AAV4RKW7_9ARAC|nr:hypothetical protein CDAR_229031 [Caerostris darwini]GIY20795.1 hypothetical protein CDAR_229091 [Caerostris darwini]
MKFTKPLTIYSGEFRSNPFCSKPDSNLCVLLPQDIGNKQPHHKADFRLPISFDKIPETQLIILAWIENAFGTLNRGSFNPKLHVLNIGGTILPASVE